LARYLPNLSAIADIVPSGASAPPGCLWTVGHSTRDRSELTELLERHAIELLVDVRAFPRSRRVPHFDSGVLESSLRDRRIAYEHLPELGGRRRPVEGSPNGGWESAAFQGYADHMASPEFAAGLDRLASLAQDRRTAIMCAEAAWWRCHRRLIADALTVQGFRVEHIGAGRGVAHELTTFAVVEDGRITYPPGQASLDV
jgi:uncharacterized protein (DUF488 family)